MRTSTKTYQIVQIISANKRTGGFQATVRDDKGRIVTRHLDHQLRGNNPNRECVRLHAFCTARIAYLSASLTKLRQSLTALGEGKLTITAPMTPDMLKSIWVGRQAETSENLKRAEETLSKLQAEMPLIAQFVR